MTDPAKETPEDLKEQAHSGEPKKGYNESNPTQKQGAFEPDSKDEQTPDEAPAATNK